MSRARTKAQLIDELRQAYGRAAALEQQIASSKRAERLAAALSRQARAVSALASALREPREPLDVLGPLVTAALAATDAPEGSAGVLEDGRIVFRQRHVGPAVRPVDCAYEPGQGAAGRVLQTSEPYLAEATDLDAHAVPGAEDEHPPAGVLAVPIPARSGQVLGCLEVHHTSARRRFAERDVAALRVLANLAATAMENASLRARGDRTEEQHKRACRNWQAVLAASGLATIVVDAEHKVIRANPAAEEILGQSEEMLRGTSCRELLPGLSDGVTPCPLSAAGPSTPAIVETELAGSRRKLLLSCTPSGDEAENARHVVHILAGTGERQNLLADLVASVSTRTIHCAADHVDAEITQALQTIGEHTDVDRVDVWQFSGEEEGPRNTHHWLRESLAPAGGPAEDLSAEPPTWAMPRHEWGEVVHVSRVSELPPEADVERRLCRRRGIRSFVRVPLTCEEKVLGFVAFSTVRRERNWSPDTVVVLRLLGEILANALDRKRTREEVANLERFPSDNPNPVLRVSADGMVLYSNEAGLPLLDAWGHRPGRPLSGPWRERAFTSLRDGQGEQIEVFCAGKFYSVMFAPVSARDYVNVYGLDITSRKEKERALRTSETNYREIFDAANDAIFVHDIETGEILDCNRKTCEMYGYTREEICRASVVDLSAEASGYTQDNALGRVAKAAEGWPQVFEWQAKRRRGDLFWVEVNLKCARIGGCLRTLAVVRDIGDRKRAEAERQALEVRIQQARKLESLGVLAGGIAHDFNNLLMVILGNADLSLLELPEELPARRTVQEIKQAALRASELTSQMLAYSGKRALRARPLDLNEMIREMSRLLEVSRSEKITVRHDLAEDLPPVVADAAQMRQVVMNLITNASDAIGGAEGTIAIRTGVQEATVGHFADTYLQEAGTGPYVYLEVSDTGCGMDPETQAKVFDPFFTTKFTGRGLGLAAVLGIVRSHHGVVEIHSDVGRGTLFRILLPMDPQAVLPEALAEESVAGTAGLAMTGTILLADDEDNVRDVGKAMLETAGLTVLTAADGQEAVEIFRNHADGIDAVLLDVTMPRFDGRHAMRAIREIRPDVPVLLCSGYGEQDATRGLEDPHEAGFIQKPYQLDQLLAAVRDVLDRPA